MKWDLVYFTIVNIVFKINTISIQYQYNINQTGDENKEKYKFEDFLVDPISISQK